MIRFRVWPLHISCRRTRRWQLSSACDHQTRLFRNSEVRRLGDCVKFSRPAHHYGDDKHRLVVAYTCQPPHPTRWLNSFIIDTATANIIIASRRHKTLRLPATGDRIPEMPSRIDPQFRQKVSYAYTAAL